MNKQDSSSDPDQTVTDSRRTIRSYVIRGGRLTDSQRKAIQQYGDDFVIDFQGHLLDLASRFPRPGALVVEIGFGMGESLLEMATARPQENFLGIEVHKPGVGKLLRGVAAAGLSNLRVICHDAREVLQQGIADASLERVQIFFPDPWHKKRHNKRRLIQADFVELLGSKLRSGGVLHLATDWEPYAMQMLEVLEQNESFENQAGRGKFSDPGERPVTKFERRGRKLGHGVWDLRFRRR